MKAKISLVPAFLERELKQRKWEINKWWPTFQPPKLQESSASSVLWTLLSSKFPLINKKLSLFGENNVSQLALPYLLDVYLYMWSTNPRLIKHRCTTTCTLYNSISSTWSCHSLFFIHMPWLLIIWCSLYLHCIKSVYHINRFWLVFSWLTEDTTGMYLLTYIGGTKRTATKLLNVIVTQSMFPDTDMITVMLLAWCKSVFFSIFSQHLGIFCQYRY